MGTAAEVQIQLQILCLLRDAYGLHLLNKETVLSDRAPLEAFNRQDWSREKSALTVSVNRLDYHGRLLEDAIEIDFFLEYFLRATQEQAVTVVSANNEERFPLSPISEALPLKILPPPIEENELTRKLQADILRIEAEKASLKGKLRQQGRNARSLKHGLKKAELKNLELQNKIRSCEHMITDLQKSIHEKERQITLLRGNDGYYPEYHPAGGEYAKNPKAGKIIKRLFQNNA
jgi:hypothetical protein